MQAKKSLGQNFLLSTRVRDQIIESAHLSEKDTVLEIGPGHGFLTEALVEAAGHVIAVEKDDALAPELETTFATDIAAGKLEILHGDILEIGLRLKQPYKLVANIPYYITGEILRHFLSIETQPSDMVLMLQREVAERIVARNGKESILSLSVKAYGNPKIITRVSAGSFRPVPNVDSAVLSVSDISKDFFSNFSEKLFFTFIKTGFGQKRKTLANNLSELIEKPRIEKILESMNRPAGTRAEDLNLREWKQFIETIR